jgi:hypothetical protein
MAQRILGRLVCGNAPIKNQPTAYSTGSTGRARQRTLTSHSLKVGRPTLRDYLTYVKYTVWKYTVWQVVRTGHSEGDTVCETTSVVTVLDSEWLAHAKGAVDLLSKCV